MTMREGFDEFADNLRTVITSPTKQETFTDFSQDIDLFAMGAVSKRVLAYGGTRLYVEMLDQKGQVRSYRIPENIGVLFENIRISKIYAQTDCEEVTIEW